LAQTPSPCTGTCRLDAREVCVGCGRTIGEIIDWRGASEARRQQIVADARERLSIIRKPDEPAEPR
jgi:uncharacterized protein